MILIVHSKKDIAGTNISNHILQNYPFHKTNQTFQTNPTYQAKINEKQITHITLTEEATNAQTLPENFPTAQLIVFISRHSSQSGTPTLSVHTPGNLGTAELGGIPKTVSISPASAMQTALKALNRLKHDHNLEYQVSYECTHHGPSLNTPTMFVELGSSEKQWSDQTAANTVAQATMEAITNFENPQAQASIGIGGTHYNQKFTKLSLENQAVFSHMIPKYAISNLDTQIIKHCIKQTHEQVKGAILDWKGIKSEDKPKLITLLQETGLPYTKT
jgi:D-aminoacyl-tRNA deacylase